MLVECRAKEVGQGNLVEAKAMIAPRAHIKDHCKVGAFCIVKDAEALDSHTIVFGEHSTRRIEPKFRMPTGYKAQRQALHASMPSFHQLYSPN
eukprot:m.82267 g.82267  ORF g.82267 m.82267 type:complete len:93 (-) comp12682_c0_seq1:114-392(-)